jgi:hypothetical protein
MMRFRRVRRATPMSELVIRDREEALSTPLGIRFALKAAELPSRR